MYTIFNVLDQDEKKGVLFKEEYFDGMVSESIYMISAWEVKESDCGVPEIGVQLHLEDLKKIYKTMTSKKERLSFWRYMREFTDAVKTEREIERTAEAISKII